MDPNLPPLPSSNPVVSSTPSPLPSTPPSVSKKRLFRICGAGLFLLGLIIFIGAVINRETTLPSQIINRVSTPSSTPPKVLPSWETYTSQLGFSIQYESPLYFNTALKNNEETLTYFKKNSNGNKTEYLKVAVSFTPTEVLKTEDLPQRKDPKARMTNLGNVKAVTLLSTTPEQQYFFVANKKLYQITVTSHPEDQQNLPQTQKILKSFMVY